MGRSRLVLFCLASTLIHADVFLRQPVDIPGRWQRAYQAPLRLQNGTGELEIYQTGDSLELIETAMRERHGKDLVWVPGEVMAWAMIVQDGWLVRYLVQPLPDGGYWITSYRQRLRNAGRPGEAPDRHRLKELPVLPQSTPGHYSHNEENQTTVEISETMMSPETALTGMARLIEAEGWTPSPVNTGGFQVFVKGEKVAFIGAQRGKDGKTRILRLHKPLGVK